MENNTALRTDLGDFTTDGRMILLSVLACVIGALGAGIAWGLSRLIGLFTNLFFFGHWDFTLRSPTGNHLGLWVILIPAAGGLIIGFMARYGSEKIRGHGIPEALEAILLRGSRVEPRVAVLKPLSSAISIGSGGPFGAEGPIIMTGGAIGSIVAQFFHLTGAERKTLLVAGAAAGMSATFGAPLASVALAVELLLFEWKPRSLVPVALASAVAAFMRFGLLGMAPMFSTPAHPGFIGLSGLGACIVAGLLAGGLSALMTLAVYAAEDAFGHLPIHWMWWPVIGGLAVGVGGWIFPQALGVGYETIGNLLTGSVPLRDIAGILAVKGTIWAIALGSGTSGGVLAPLLMMGGALGGLEDRAFLAMGLHDLGPGFWPMVSMGAIMGGTMRSPFTGVIFVLELTHDINLLLPLLLATAIAHGFTVLVMRRSILTEKLSRRGFHLSREYEVDPLENLSVADVMRPIHDEVFAATDDAPVFADDRLRSVVYRMAETRVTELPVVTRADPREPVAVINLHDLLQARVRNLQEETHRQRHLGPRRTGESNDSQSSDS